MDFNQPRQTANTQFVSIDGLYLSLKMLWVFDPFRVLKNWTQKCLFQAKQGELTC